MHNIGGNNMSQRLHIGKTEESSVYDCILEDSRDAKKKILSEWVCLKNSIFFGPWKIRISDTELFDELQPMLVDLFKSLGKQYPDDVWAFYQDNRIIEHPTKRKLSNWVKYPDRA